MAVKDSIAYLSFQENFNHESKNNNIRDANGREWLLWEIDVRTQMDINVGNELYTLYLSRLKISNDCFKP